ncbi:MAG: copper resistance protein CopC [Actinobacteria bacterium]|nr:copper resistance protein CopC [Actinomycetota bacterium]
MRKVLGALCAAVATALSAVLLGAALVAGAAPAAAASPTLVSSSPAAKARLSSWPDAVTLTFSERVAKGTALVRVDGPGGVVSSTGRTATDGRTVTQPLAQKAGKGEYVVRWTVVLQDGTQLAGTIPYTYGTGAKPATQSRTVVAAENGVDAARSNPAAGALLVGVLVVALAWGFKRLRSGFGR